MFSINRKHLLNMRNVNEEIVGFLFNMRKIIFFNVPEKCSPTREVELKA